MPTGTQPGRRPPRAETIWKRRAFQGDKAALASQLDSETSSGRRGTELTVALPCGLSGAGTVPVAWSEK